jgi:O-antigen ligase
VGLGAGIGVSPFWTAAIFTAVLLFAGYVLLLLRYPERGLWLLAVGLPYERLGALPLPGFTLKFGHVVAAFIVLSLAARTAITKTFRFAADPLRIPLLLLLFASILSLVNAPDLVRGASLIGQLLVGFLIYFCVVQLLGRRNVWPTLAALWLGATIVTVFGLYQFVGDFLGLPTEITGLVPSYSGAAAFGFARITGPSLEPLYFANYLLLPILTATAFLLGTKGKGRIRLGAFLALAGTVLVLTLARGAFLGLAAGLIIIGLRYWRQIFKPKVIITGLVVVLIAITAAGWLLIKSANGNEDPLESFAHQLGVTGKDVSSQQRVGTVEAAAGLVKDYPLTGVGVGNFGHYYQDPSSTVSDNQVPQTVHNQPFETLVETGIIGLATLALVGFVLLKRTIEAWRKVRGAFLTAALVGSAAAVLAIFVQAQTFSAIYLMHVWFAIGLLVAVQNLILVPRKSAGAIEGKS